MSIKCKFITTLAAHVPLNENETKVAGFNFVFPPQASTGRQLLSCRQIHHNSPPGSTHLLNSIYTRVSTLMVGTQQVGEDARPLDIGEVMQVKLCWSYFISLF